MTGCCRQVIWRLLLPQLKPQTLKDGNEKLDEVRDRDSQVPPLIAYTAHPPRLTPPVVCWFVAQGGKSLMAAH